MRGLDAIIGGGDDEAPPVRVHLVHNTSPMPLWEKATIGAALVTVALEIWKHWRR